MRAAPRLAVASASLAVVVALAGCGGDEEEPAGEPAPTSTTPSPSTTEEGSAAEPSQDAETREAEPFSVLEGVEPATGEEASFDGVSFRVPQDFVIQDIDEFGLLAAGMEQLSARQLNMSIVRSGSTIVPTRTAARQFIEVGGYDPDPKILEPVMVGGIEMFHVAGRINSVTWVEAFGAITDEWQYGFEFRLDRRMPAKERLALVESLLATVEIP